MRITTLHRLSGDELKALVARELERRGLKNVRSTMITFWWNGYFPEMGAVYQEGETEGDQ
jgi:hypothetical protein